MKKIVSSLAIILILVALTACNQNEDSTNDEEVERVTPVKTAKATEGDLVVEKTVYGRTSPIRSTPVMAQTPGEVDSIEKNEGDQVNKDDLLFVITTPAGKMNIRAPKDGKLMNVTAVEGEMVSTEEPVAIVADDTSVKVKFSVTGSMHHLFKIKETLQALYDEEKHKAEITSIASMPDETGLYPVEAMIENENEAILPGEIIEMIVPVKRVKNTVIVPTEAIIEEAGKSFLYVAKDSQVEKIEIDIKETQSDQTAIKGAVKKGDHIVVNGQLTLSDGSKIKVVEEGEE